MPFARGMLGMPCFIFVFFCGVLIYPETHLHFIPSVSFFHCAPSLWYHLHSRAPSRHTYICTYARSFSGHTSSFGYFGVFSLKHRAHFKKKQCHSEIKTKPSSKNREFSKSRLLLIPWNIKIWVPSLILVAHLQQISALRDNSTTRYGVNKFPSVTHVRTYEHHPSWA